MQNLQISDSNDVKKFTILIYQKIIQQLLTKSQSIYQYFCSLTDTFGKLTDYAL